MTGKNALKKLYFDNKDLNVEITLNDRKVCEIYNIIKDYLEKMEKLEKEYNTIKFCYEKLTKDHNSLKKDFNELFETSNIFYNTKEKYKNAIEILKDNFPIRFLGYNKYGAKPYEIMVNGYIQGFDKEPYELLKEVLNYEKL